MEKYVSYPLENTLYTAQEAQLYSSTRTSGVYSSERELRVTSNSDMTVTVTQGRAWIKPSMFTGFVFGSMEDVILPISNADTQFKRIDLVVAGFSATDNMTTIYIKEGIPSASPVKPTVTRDEATFELGLAFVEVNAGTTGIQPSQIIDLRLDETYCGLMADGVTRIPTQSLEDEFRDWFNNLQANLEGDVATNLVNRINQLEIELDDTRTSLEAEISSFGTPIFKYKVPEAWYFIGTQSVDFPLGQRVSDGQKGVVLVWGGYDPATKQIKDYWYQHCFIAKEFINGFAGKRSLFNLVKDNTGGPVIKSAYISNDRITGHNDNGSTTIQGGNNKYLILREIYII